MELFNVGGTWISPAPFDAETMSRVAATFRPADESFCFSVDPKDARRLEMSWDEPAATVEEAARQCKRSLDELLVLHDGGARLTEITVSTEEGYWRTTSPDEDLPREG